MGDRRAWKQEAADGGTSNNNKNNRRARAPKGHFVVYVGKELKRFVVPLSLLKSFKFQQLLDKAAEEYGYSFGREHQALLLEQVVLCKSLMALQGLGKDEGEARRGLSNL
ncbi:hypothetical protein FEM48_ZijujUnG0078700 [Ziziphus jujuba var. spinosa]|uniref:Uncharacterized protein n=1 Tax=Ziziphus jujuba var. spinosa TaxID=714518 RepID=A0A978U8Q4_ZIZJJ|nr:hypothetical protein FEM48_ZijujUnG0078700 [Ziziphus jujuba var. spinosa]